ncbi:MAG: insulinase family protein [Candidatus Micrarchaeia archaeon]
MLKEKEARINAEIKRVMDFANKAKVEKRILSNGLTVIGVREETHAIIETEGEGLIIRETKDSPAADLALWVKSGQRHDPRKLPELAHLTEHMVVRGGTKLHTSKEMEEAYSALKVLLVANTNSTYTEYFSEPVSVHEKDLPVLLGLLSENVFAATLAENFDREKQNLKYELKSKRSPMADSIDRFIGARFEGRIGSLVGITSAIENISLQNVRGFYSTFYAPNNAILGIIGNIDSSVFDSVASAFSDFGAKEIPRIDLEVKKKEYRDSIEKIVVVPSIDYHIECFFPAPDRGCAELSVACMVLYNRLYGHSREGIKYFPYYIFGIGEIGFIGNKIHGPGLRHRIEYARKILEDEIKRISDGELTDEEMIESKEYVLQEMAKKNYSTEKRRLKTILGVEMGYDPSNILSSLLTVTKEGVAEAVQKYMNLAECFTVIYEPSIRAVKQAISRVFRSNE